MRFKTAFDIPVLFVKPASDNIQALFRETFNARKL